MVDFGIVQFKFLSNKNQPERVDDTDVHHTIEINWLVLEVVLNGINKIIYELQFSFNSNLFAKEIKTSPWEAQKA